MLEELAAPFGYVYHCCCGFFSSTIDAWQKAAGYTWFYDYMAPRFQMVFDVLPVLCLEGCAEAIPAGLGDSSLDGLSERSSCFTYYASAPAVISSLNSQLPSPVK